MSSHFLNELRSTCEAQGDRVAIVHAGREVSYAELDRRARNGAALLQQHGLQPGERVVLFTPAKLPFLLAHLSILYGGGISIPLNPGFTREEMRHFLSDSGARLAVAAPAQADLLHTLGVEGLTVLPDLALVDAPAASCRDHSAAADAPCLLIYSSGTTGLPKGVVHTHANLSASLRALQTCWRFTPEDVVVNVLPLFHIHGLSIAAHLALLVGGCTMLEDAFHPVQTLDVVGRGTVFMAVPTIYYRFLEQPTFADKARSWSGVRLFTCGSAPIRADVLPQLEQLLGKPVINRYGMTEAHVLTSLPLDGPWPTGSVGLPLDGIEVRVARPDDHPASPGEVGAVRVRGLNLFRDYWRNPEATRKAFATGWFDTGDLGSLDERGFLTLVGRSNDLIITNGYNVYPQVVERVINACPGVRESAVVGVPDAIRGERVAAFVVRDQAQLDQAGLEAFWGDRLIDYQRPRQVVFVEALPRNALGKVLRQELVKQIASMS